MAHDGKKVLYFVRKCSIEAQIIKDAYTRLQALKTEWQAADPDVTQVPVIITAQQAVDFNAFKNSIETVITDNSTVIDQFEAIANAHPSHDVSSMDAWD